MSSYTIKPISKEPFLFGESPLWDNRRDQLVFTNCFGKRVSIFDPHSGEITSKVVTLPDDEFLWSGFSMPYSSSTNTFLVSTSSGKLVEFDWEEGAVTKILYELPNPLLNFEDAKCDSKGRLWTGTACFDDIGTLKVVPGKGKLHNFSPSKTKSSLDCDTSDGNFDVPNGLGWNKEETKLFWNDLTRRVVNVFDFDATTGGLENRKTVFDFNDHPDQLTQSSMPDGLCVDLSGNVWIACWQGGCVIKIDGATGKLLEKVDVPASNVTSLAFGGKAYERIYITTTSINLDQSPVQGEPHAGKLFQLRNDKDNSFKGFQENFFDL